MSTLVPTCQIVQVTSEKEGQLWYIWALRQKPKQELIQKTLCLGFDLLRFWSKVWKRNNFNALLSVPPTWRRWIWDLGTWANEWFSLYKSDRWWADTCTPDDLSLILRLDSHMLRKLWLEKPTNERKMDADSRLKTVTTTSKKARKIVMTTAFVLYPLC